jgi:hypothetical protein
MNEALRLAIHVLRSAVRVLKLKLRVPRLKTRDRKFTIEVYETNLM